MFVDDDDRLALDETGKTWDHQAHLPATKSAHLVMVAGTPQVMLQNDASVDVWKMLPLP